MALTDKLNTIDTIGDLARNGDFLGELANQLDESKVQTILGKITTASKKVVQVSDLGEDTVVTPIVSSDKFKTAVLNDAGNPITTVNDLLTKLTTGDNKNEKVYTEKAVDDVFVKTEELATKVADKDVVKAIFNAKEQPADTQSILATKVADKDVVKAIFNAKEQPADTQSIFATKVAEQAVVDVLVPALATVGTDDTKKVYTEKAVDDVFVKTEELATKVVDKDVVKAIFNAKEQPADTQSIFATKVAEQAVVDVLVPALATVGTDDTKKVYTQKAVDDVFVKTEELATKVVDKDVVKAIFNAKEQPADTQSIFATKVAEQAVVDVLVPALATVGTDDTKKVYTQKAVDDALKLKADASALNNLVLEKGPSADAVATQLLSNAKTKDDLGKAILGVTKEVDGTAKPALETDLAGNKILQDAVASNGTLKAALAKPADIAAVPALKTAIVTQLLSDANKDKLGTAILGVTKKVDNVDKPALETNLAANPGLKTAVKTALAGDGNFKSAVKVAVNAEEIREVMSQPVFEIPADDNAPLSWDW